MKEITICIPTWGRHEIFNIVANHLFYLQKKITAYKINVMIGLSPNEDMEEQLLYSTCLNYNFGYCTHPNEQLGAKHNHIINSAFQSYPNTDYIMNLGSDDLIHENLFDIYAEYIEKEEVYFGIDTCYFWNKITNEAIKFHYEKDFVIGAGRMLHKSIFKVIKNIYDPHVTSSLDSNSSKNMRHSGFVRYKIGVDDFPYIVDIKANNNINSFYKIIELVPESCTVVNPSIILSKYSLIDDGAMVVDSCNVEFGYELLSAIPYAYWLNEKGLLKETISAKGSEAMYYFSPKHTINKGNRKYENIKNAAHKNIPNVAIHRHFLDFHKFKAPDYLKRYKNKEYVYDKPIVCICNRFNNEWGGSPINYFSIDCLDKMFAMLKDYQIIYWAVDIPKVLQDGVEPLKLNDREFIKEKHPEVLIFQDLLGKKDWNTEQLKIFANCRRFITMNGGYSILASFFAGQNIIFSKPGTRQTKEIAIGSFQRWYPEINNCRIKYSDSYKTLYENIQMLFVEKLPTVNIIVRTCQRPNFFKTCIESIEKQDYPNINIVVGCEKEDAESLKYLIKYKHRLTFYNKVYAEPKKPSGDSYGVYFPFNHYLDEVNKRVTGWIMYLDDDDILLDTKAVSKIVSNIKTNNDVIFWRCKFGNRIIPNDENFQKEIPVCCDISGIGFMFHSKFVPEIEWGYWKRGDYRVASKLFNIGNHKFINEILTGIQTEAHNGKIVDKKSQDIKQQPMTNHTVRCESLHRKFGLIGKETIMEKHLAEILERQGYVKIIR